MSGQDGRSGRCGLLDDPAIIGGFVAGLTKKDRLAYKYHHTHDPEIPEQILELARRLGEMEH
jgi:hypothetical protein